MTDRFTEAELLAWIEDDLSPRARAALDARLAGEPGVRTALEEMRADRSALRSAGEPAVPVDFLAELEPRLARPMLMDYQPGAYRRRRRRSRRMARIARVAIAAIVVLAVFGGVWVGALALRDRVAGPAPARLALGPDGAPAPTPDGSPGPADAARRRGGPRDATSAVATGDADAVAWPPPATVIHHHGPSDARSSTTVPAGVPATAVATAASAAPAAAEPDPVVSAFALVIRAPDVATAEAALAAALGDDAEATLVRNFSMDEARLLLARHGGRRAPFGPGAPAVAGVGESATAQPELRRWRAEEIARGLRRAQNADAADEAFVSRRLHGPQAHAPTYEVQLALSERGATHAIAIRSDRLAAVLERLRDDTETTLRAMPPDDAALDFDPDAPPRDLARWVEDLRVVREFTARLRGAHADDAVLLLPVVVEP